MKRILSLAIVLSVLLSMLPKSASATYANPYFMDPYFQTPDSGIEKNIFWKTYLYAMFTDDPWLDKSLKFYPSSSSYSTTISNTVSAWNAIRPASIERAKKVTTSGAADLVYNYANCPFGDPAAKLACWIPDTWGNLGTLNVNAWYKSSIYIRPDAYVIPGSNPVKTQYYTSSGGLIQNIMHEFGHVAGLNEQYHNWWWLDTVCNTGYTSIMDGFYVSSDSPTTQIVSPCDPMSTPNSSDKGMWNSYHTGGRYLPYSYVVYGDPANLGKAATSWYDYAWSDYQMQATWWRCGSSSTCAGSVLFATTYHIGENGSHYDVPGADTRRVIAYAYPNTQYNVHNQYIRVCVKPVYNYVAPIGEERCMTPFHYGY